MDVPVNPHELMAEAATKGIADSLSSLGAVQALANLRKRIENLPSIDFTIRNVLALFDEELKKLGYEEDQPLPAPEIELQPVESSNISRIGYSSKSSVLRIRFRFGSDYEYDNVPQEEFERFYASPSKGKYFAAHIRDQYPTRKMS